MARAEKRGGSKQELSELLRALRLGDVRRVFKDRYGYE